MSTIGLFAVVVLIIVSSMIIIESIYGGKYLAWKENHVLAFILLDSLLVYVVLDMALIALFDAAGEELWTSEHQFLMLLFAGFSLLFGISFSEIVLPDRKPCEKDKKRSPWSRARPPFVVALFCLTVWLLIINDFARAVFMAIFCVLLFFSKGEAYVTERGVRGYTILMEGSMRKVDRPEAVLRRTIQRMVQREKPSMDEILDILRYFKDQDDEVGREARKLLDELSLVP